MTKIRNRGPGDSESDGLEPGATIRVAGRPGVWTVVRDTGGALIIIRRGKEYTSTPRENTRPPHKKTSRPGHTQDRSGT